MQKVTEFLERNVQWFVLGLAVLFLGVTVYKYWLQPPTVKVGGQDLPPGRVNQAILDGPVRQIRDDLKKPVPTIEVKNHVAAFVSDMGFRNEEVAVAFRPLTSENFVGSLIREEKGPEGPGPNDYVVERLPVLPALKKPETSNGRVVVNYPDPKAKPGDGDDDDNNNDAAGARAGVRRAVAGGAAAAADGAPMIEKDVDYITVAADLPVKALKAAWDKAIPEKPDMPPGLRETKLLRVELIRQEKLANGSWGPETVVPPLALYDLPPLPADNAGSKEKFEYLNWANENPDAIGQPPFYQTVTGQWYAPGEDQPGVQQVGGTPNRRMTAAERRQQREMERMRRGGPGGGFPGGFPGGPGMGPRPGGGRTYPYYSPPPPGNRRSGGRGNYPGGFGPMGPMGPMGPYGPAMPGGGRNPYPPMPGAGRMPFPGGGQPGQGALGGGNAVINIDQLQDDIRIWAHDDKAQPGKTYRYKLRYYVYNPLFELGNVAKDPNMTKPLTLKSPDSAWTQAVKVTDRINFWLVQATRRQAKFDVFDWRGGEWNKKVRSLEPGDPIGGDWTLADLREGPRGIYALIINGRTGATEQRFTQRDARDELYRRLQDEVGGGEDAAAGAR